MTVASHFKSPFRQNAASVQEDWRTKVGGKLKDIRLQHEAAKSVNISSQIKAPVVRAIVTPNNFRMT